MRPNSALQVIFAFFLGLVVVAFIGIAVATFYPQPVYPDNLNTEVAQNAWNVTFSAWQLITGVVLLVCATVILAVSLFLPENQGVLSNGILMGGVFTMVYAVGMTFAADTSWLRLVMVTVALVVTIAIGYLKFVRGHRGVAVAGGGYSDEAVGDLGARLSSVERKLDALGRALHE